MSTIHFKTSKQAYLEKKSSGHDSQDVIRSLLKTPVEVFFSNLQGDLLLMGLQIQSQTNMKSWARGNRKILNWHISMSKSQFRHLS